LLARFPVDAKWPVFRKLMDDASPLVRASVAESLGERLDPANVAALLRATGDDYRLVRVRAASALASIPPERLPEERRRCVQDATAEFMASMTARPDDMASHYNLGNFHMARGQLPEAVTAFETAIRLQPDALPPHVNAALAYSALNRNDQAEASLRRALRLDPTNAAVNLNLGMLWAELGRLSEAEQAFRAAFKADPHSAQTAYNLGVLLSNDRPDEAITWCRRAADLRPDDPRYGYTYAFYLHRAGRRDHALEVIRGVRARHPTHEDAVMLERALLRDQARQRGQGKSQ